MYERSKQLTAKILFASVGVALVYLITKHRKTVFQRFTRIRTSLIDPLRHQQIIVVNSSLECQDIVHELTLKCLDVRVLGFDCEWVTTNGSRHQVALLQLASSDGLCALIRLCKFRHISMDLKKLLEDSSILKVGVVPSDDAKYLLQDYGVNVRGCLDLRHLAARAGALAKGGLAGLAENVLGVKLDKSWRIRCSNWEAEELTSKQAEYAARDALVAVEIFNALIRDQLRPESYFWQICYWNSMERSARITKLCKCFVDVKYKQKAQQLSSGDTSESAQAVKSGTKVSRTQLKPISRAYSTRQKPLYHNCYMQAPDGMVLCTCDRKKAEWYVLKNLAEVVSREPFTVRLKFEPSGRAVGEVGNYYTQEKANCCVVCGRTDTYVRKNIVPHEYRKFFPRVMKDHTSHDVLLLCLDCHQQCNYNDVHLREQLALECNAPIGTQDDVKTFEVPELRQVRMAAKALLNSAHKIPQQRKEDLKNVILEYFKNDTEINNDILIKAIDIQSSVFNQNYEPHGSKVVQFYSHASGKGLVCLEQMWREHFLTTMKPQCLPALWSVTHNHHRLIQKAEQNRILPQDLNVAGLQHLV